MSEDQVMKTWRILEMILQKNLRDRKQSNYFIIIYALLTLQHHRPCEQAAASIFVANLFFKLVYGSVYTEDFCMRYNHAVVCFEDTSSRDCARDSD